MPHLDTLKDWLGNQQERQAFIEQIRLHLPAEQVERITHVLECLIWLLGVLDKKNLSLAKLRQLCFGATTETARNVCGTTPVPKEKKKAKGHGRTSHRSYTGARRVGVSHPTLKPGDQCPGCGKGKVRKWKKPAVAITVTAQPPVGAVIHEMEQLRCDTCGRLFTAPTPQEAGTEKYDPSVGVMAALMRYGSGMPSYRLERFQKSLGVPLPASVQWEQIERVAEPVSPLIDHLLLRLAQGMVFFSDDTTMRVLAVRKEIQAQSKPKRTGIFTSGIVGEVDGHKVSLFFTGRKHAGENLSNVLNLRETQHPPPLHMCDGLSRNDPKGHKTLECQCNVHARRNFVDLRNSFPKECLKVIQTFSALYRLEAQIKELGLSADQRLQVHQTHSQPLMDELKAWLTNLIDDKIVEPNSTLGGAIAYMQSRWTELTQFLRVPGAPLDNNEAERMLKMSILHRKNSLFYRTQRGAEVGDLFMSIVQTCRNNDVNPFDYLMAVVSNAARVKSDPAAWMPWNYPTALDHPPASSPSSH